MRDLEKIELVMAKVTKTSNWKAKAEALMKNDSTSLRRSTEIALRVLDELDNRGVTQADLARRMEVSPQHISKLLRGQENLTLETIGRIEDALNINLINVAEPTSSSEQNVHTLVENAKFFETVEIDSSSEVDNNNNKVRPLYNNARSKYYE